VITLSGLRCPYKTTVDHLVGERRVGDHDDSSVGNGAMSRDADGVEIHLIDVDFVEARVTEEGVQVVEGFLAGDDATVFGHVRSPRAVNSFFLDNMDVVRNLQNILDPLIEMYATFAFALTL